MLRNLVIVASLAALSACTFDTEADLGVGEETLWWRLGSRETLSLQQPSTVGVRAEDRDGQELACVDPDVMGGRAVLRSTADGLLLVEALEVSLSDITIEQDVLGAKRPLHLTDVELRLGTQLVLDPEWLDDYAVGAGTADLLMDWAVLTDDGNVHPLATQLIRDVEFEVEVRLEHDGSISAQVHTTVAGPIWDFNVLEVSDLSVDVLANTAY